MNCYTVTKRNKIRNIITLLFVMVYDNCYVVTEY